MLDDALTRLRKPLEKLAGHGGDPRFALVVLVSARWRRLRSPGREIPRWIRLLERVAREEELHTLLGNMKSSQLKGAVDESLKFLKAFAWQDEGVFETLGTRRQHADRRRESSHVRRAATVLDWHLREGTTGRWHRRELLAQLLDSVGLLRYRRGGDPVEQVNRRLGRIKGDYYEKFEISQAGWTFHHIHQFLSATLRDSALTSCGTACPPALNDLRDRFDDNFYIESFQPAPGLREDQQPGESATQGAGDDTPIVTAKTTILDKHEAKMGPAPPSPIEDQPDSSIDPGIPEKPGDS